MTLAVSGTQGEHHYMLLWVFQCIMEAIALPPPFWRSSNPVGAHVLQGPVQTTACFPLLLVFWCFRHVGMGVGVVVGGGFGLTFCLASSSGRTCLSSGGFASFTEEFH